MELRGILETAIYVDNLDAAEEFYGRVLGLHRIHRDPNRHVFFRSGTSVFLIFNPETTANEPASVDGKLVPNHGARGASHVAFRVHDKELAAWRDRLGREQIPIESEIAWPRGGHSIYFRDPAGNSIELASPKLWGLPED